MTEQIFTIDEARALMPAVLTRVDELIPVRAELTEKAHDLARGGNVQIPEVKALEARLSELLDWFRDQGIAVKGYAPLLLDFPMEHDGRSVLLCWLEGERTLDWYHDENHGFMGRRPLDELDGG